MSMRSAQERSGGVSRNRHLEGAAMFADGVSGEIGIMP
jgi:hypothetical protein